MIKRGSLITPGITIPKNTTSEIQQAFLSIKDRIASTDRTLTELKTSFTQSTAEIEEEIPSSDTTPPKPISGLTSTKFETHIRLAWTPSISSDVSYIRVNKTKDAVPESEEAIVSSPTNFLDDLDIIATSDYVYTLVAVDTSGNESTSVQTTISAATVPAPDEVLNKTWNGDDLETYWDPVDGFGVTGYRVMIYKGVVRLRTTDVTTAKYIYTFAENGVDGLSYSVTVRVYTLDALGNPSISYAYKTITHTPPPAVKNIKASVVELGFIVSWDLIVSSAILGYDISLNGVAIEKNYTTGNYLYKTQLIAGDYLFGVKSKNKLGQYSSEAVIPRTVTGPGKPASLIAQVIDNSVTLLWSAPAIIELPITEYEIRRGDVFGTATSQGRKKGTFTIINEVISGTYTYWVAAIDTAGNIGIPASAITYVDQPPDFVLNVLWVNDFIDGTATNFLVQDDGTAIAPFDTTQTWEDHFVGTGSIGTPQFLDIQDLIDAGYTYYPEPVPLSAEYYEEHDYGAILPSSSITSTADKLDFNGGPTTVTKLAFKELPGDAYTDVTNTRVFGINFQYVRDKFELTSDGTEFSLYYNHRLQLDTKLKSDAGNASITTASTGVTIQFNQSFIDVTTVEAQARGDGSTPLATIVDFVDSGTPPPTEFTVYLFNTDTGAKVTGDISWSAKGY